MEKLSDSLNDFLRQPIREAGDRVTEKDFVRRPDVQAAYRDTVGTPRANGMLAASAALMPELNANRAALLALLCGSWVEDGASPRTAFASALDALRHALALLRPYCADDESEENEAARQVRADLEARNAAQRLPIDTAHHAADLLVLPLMTMLMRDPHNHRDFVADTALLDTINAMAGNTTLPFEKLHFLQRAANLSYEDELVVVLPASRSGLVVRVHGVNNNFHAISLLQPWITAFGHPLGLRGAKALESLPSRWKRLLSREAAPEPVVMTEAPDDDHAQYLWLQAPAYEKGKLVNRMAWAWGEAPVRSNHRKNGRCVLIALDTDERPSRSWSGFVGSFHEAQQPSVDPVRLLTADEVANYLD